MSQVPSNLKKVEFEQRRLLTGLIRKASRTIFGLMYRFGALSEYEDFATHIPLSSYDELLPLFEKIKKGEPNVLWPGTTNRWAISSGTSGSGKHIPLFVDRLNSDQKFHRNAALNIIQTIGLFNSFSGNHLAVPGTIEKSIGPSGNFLIGEVSGHLAHLANRLLTWKQWLSPKDLAFMPWEQKFELARKYAEKNPVSIVAGVPTWVNLILKELRFPEKLKLVVTGGVKLNQFLPEWKRTLPKEILFYENFGASEGFFASAFQAGNEPLKVSTCTGVFYECEDPETGNLTPIWKVESGKIIKLVLTTDSGLWRYPMDDLIRVSKDQNNVFFEVIGRNALLIDDFGEAVYQHEYDQIFQTVGIRQYIVIGGRQVKTGLGCHYIYVDRLPGKDFRLDDELQKINRHYAIRRTTGVMKEPIIRQIDSSIFASFEQAQIKRSQSKIRRLLPNWIFRSDVEMGNWVKKIEAATEIFPD